VTHFNETFPEKVSLAESPNTTYDAFYLAAYAAHAADALRNTWDNTPDGATEGNARSPSAPPDAGRSTPLTGVELARALPRLLGPGRRVEVGPAGIYQALPLLAQREGLELVGATGELHYDRATGDPGFPQSITCVGLEEGGRAARAVESGLVYEQGTGHLRGTMRCP
jgi:hypothetical protein